MHTYLYLQDMQIATIIYHINNIRICELVTFNYCFTAQVLKVFRTPGPAACLILYVTWSRFDNIGLIKCRFLILSGMELDDDGS